VRGLGNKFVLLKQLSASFSPVKIEDQWIYTYRTFIDQNLKYIVQLIDSCNRKSTISPVGKQFLRDELTSLRQRIRPLGNAPAKMEIRAPRSS